MNSEITEGIFSPTKTHFLCTSKAGIIEFSDKYTQPGDTYDRFTFSSDDRWMMSVHEMNRIFWISMWETESGRRIWESPIAWSNFPSMAISHSGKKAVIWSIDCQVRDTSSGAIISCWSPPLQPLSVAFSPDESQIIMNMLQTCETWDIESGTRISAEDSIWNKDSELNLADRSDRRRHPLARKRWTLTLHDIVSGTSTIISEEIDSSIRLPAFSSEGSKIAAIVADEFVHVWDTCNGHLLAKSPTLKNGRNIYRLMFSPNGNQLIVSPLMHFPMFMWHINEKDKSVTDFDHDDSVAFFPNTTQMVTMSSTHDKLRIWDVAPTLRLLSTSTLISTIEEQNRKCLAISCDGTRLLTTHGLWDLGDFPLKKLVSDIVLTGKFSHDSKLLAYTILSDNNIHILDAVTGAVLHCMPHQLVFSNDSLSFSPGSNHFYGFAKYQSYMVVIRCSPTSVDQNIHSSVYHPDCMMISKPSKPSRLSKRLEGWYHGVNGVRTIWLPENMNKVWLATGSIPRYLVLGRTANDITILDMEDYLEGLPVRGIWREGGIRYVDEAEAERASALASASLPSYAFGVPYLGL